MKTINGIFEWTWIFSEAAGKAYGSYLNREAYSVNILATAEPFFYFARGRCNITGTPGPGSQSIDVYRKDFNPKESWGETWTPPPYRKYYSQISPIKSEKNIIVINNKYNPEWGQVPFNYLPMEFLEEFFEKFNNQYQIYYMRYKGKSYDLNDGYYDNVGQYESDETEYNDYELIENYSNIITIYDVMEKYKSIWDVNDSIGFNEAQLMIMSKAKHLVSVNGGSAVLSSYFGKDVMVYGHPQCESTTRGIWQTDSWLKVFNNSNIIGHIHCDKLLQDCETRWL